MTDTRIVHVSTTPIAGGPLITSRLLARHGYNSRCIGPGAEADGKDFGCDVHPKQTELRDELLGRADIIVAHIRRGMANRRWIQECWAPADMIRRGYVPLLNSARRVSIDQTGKDRNDRTTN